MNEDAIQAHCLGVDLRDRTLCRCSIPPDKRADAATCARCLGLVARWWLAEQGGTCPCCGNAFVEVAP